MAGKTLTHPTGAPVKRTLRREPGPRRPGHGTQPPRRNGGRRNGGRKEGRKGGRRNGGWDRDVSLQRK